jgi:tRNA1Val (adenine37-N6)-methyltransferase
MGNAVFHFKQFSVCQQKTAMKVGTDGVLLGAWVPVDGIRTILDVGTGTGLIALMLAQRQPEAEITAIDIDTVACGEATENFNASPWDHRLTVLHTSVQDFSNTSDYKFDLLVSNPPYFSQSLQAPCDRRSKARHDDSLSIPELLSGSKRLLNETGNLALILPVSQYEKLSLAAREHGLFERRRLLVYPNPGKPAKRTLSLWGLDLQEPNLEEHLTIECGGRHQYTADYLALTRDFYLNFP